MWWLSFALASEPIPCCSNAAAQRNITYYLRLQSELAQGDKEWSGVLWGWEPVARSTAKALPRDERAVVLELADVLAGLKQRSTRARTVDAMPQISRAMIWLAVRHAGGNTSLVEGECEGRPWLQVAGPVASPYGCGALRER